MKSFKYLTGIVLIFLMAILLTSCNRGKGGAYSQNGGTVTEYGKTYASTKSDESAVYVYGGGTYTLSNGTMSKTGDVTSNSGDFDGTNAIVLAEGGSTINLSDCDLSSEAKGQMGPSPMGRAGGQLLT